MKTIICGGRDYHLKARDIGILNDFHFCYNITEVVSGGCAGVDIAGEMWAKDKCIPIKQFIPDWVAKGKSAGPLRNQEMADYADACIAFPGGKGTADMVRRAIKNNLIVHDLREKIWQKVKKGAASVKAQSNS